MSDPFTNTLKFFGKTVIVHEALLQLLIAKAIEADRQFPTSAKQELDEFLGKKVDDPMYQMPDGVDIL